LTLLLVVLTPAIPYLPSVATLGFVPLPFNLMAMLLGITGIYVVAAEVTKHWFYRGSGPAWR
jgi:Mg2+-importing ATPase